jgi:hypothetical protein
MFRGKSAGRSQVAKAGKMGHKGLGENRPAFSTFPNFNSYAVWPSECRS